MASDPARDTEQTSLGSQLLRFIALGAGNTLFTGVIYFLLAQVLPLVIAYSIAWGVGLLVVAVLTPRIVFEAQETSVRTKVGVATAYLTAFLVGLLVTAVLDAWGWPTWAIVLASLAASASMSFLGSRWVVSRAR
jgi:putative flippase GtrA